MKRKLIRDKSNHVQREKFQESLKLIQVKEEQLMKKYENEFSKLKLENERISFKEQQLEMRLKEIDYIHESANRKIKEEIEQFKMEYDRKFELEKAQMSTKKMNIDEKEFKNSLFNEKYQSLSEESISLKNEIKSHINKIKDLEKISSNLRNDCDFLREELKLLTSSEKRSSGFLEIRDKEIIQLKEENRILKE